MLGSEPGRLCRSSPSWYRLSGTLCRSMQHARADSTPWPSRVCSPDKAGTCGPRPLLGWQWRSGQKTSDVQRSSSSLQEPRREASAGRSATGVGVSCAGAPWGGLRPDDSLRTRSSQSARDGESGARQRVCHRQGTGSGPKATSGIPSRAMTPARGGSNRDRHSRHEKLTLIQRHITRVNVQRGGCFVVFPLPTSTISSVTSRITLLLNPRRSAAAADTSRMRPA